MNIHVSSDSKFLSEERKVINEMSGEGKILDIYFSADIETDGPIPGPYSMLSFALVYAGAFDGNKFVRPSDYREVFYRELKPISSEFQKEALAVNGLDRNRLLSDGMEPVVAMQEAAEWLKSFDTKANAVLVAYPLSFDWSWLYWYFTKYNGHSPFGHSNCFDIKTAFSVKSNSPIARSGRSRLPVSLKSNRIHTHHAIDDAVEQAEIFANIFEWDGSK